MSVRGFLRGPIIGFVLWLDDDLRRSFKEAVVHFGVDDVRKQG